MMRSHFVLMLIFSLCVSAVFAGLLREEPHEQVPYRPQDVRRHDRGRARSSAGSCFRFPFKVYRLRSSVHRFYRSGFLSSPTWRCCSACRPSPRFQRCQAGFPSTTPTSPRTRGWVRLRRARPERACATCRGARCSWPSSSRSLYGVSDEYHQQFVPGRSFDVFDMLADCYRLGGGRKRGGRVEYNQTSFLIARCPLTTCSSSVSPAWPYLTVQRPQRLNALDARTLEEIRQAVLDLQQDDSIRSRHHDRRRRRAFVAGADIAEIARDTPESARQRALTRSAGVRSDRAARQAGDRRGQRVCARRRL